MRLPRLPVPASRRTRRARAGGVRSTALRGAGSRGKDRGPAHGHPLEPAQRSLLGDTAGVSEAIASVPLEAAPPLAEVSAPSELEARRALNTEYLRHHPEEVARFLDERMPSETALIVHDAGPEEAVHLLERLNPRVAADVLRPPPPHDTKLKDLVQGTPVGVHATANREEIVNYLTEQRVATLPVIDSDRRLVGVIRYRALVAAAEAEATMSMQTMVGVSKEERALSRVSFAVRQRLPWLEINLATAFLAAFVVGMFEGTIAKFTALAVLLPVVAGHSGNSGMQALAVTMRGLALREDRLSHWPRLIVKEAGVGILNGLAVASTTMVGVFIWSQSIGLTVVIGSAMILAMVMAGVSGAAIPLILKAFGQDPAQSSSIVLTTITDCSSFLSFLGLATILLRFL